MMYYTTSPSSQEVKDDGLCWVFNSRAWVLTTGQLARAMWFDVPKKERKKHQLRLYYAWATYDKIPAPEEGPKEFE